MRLAGFVIMVGAVQVFAGALLPWVIGPDGQSAVTGGLALGVQAVLVGFALIAILFGTGLMARGSALPLSVAAICAAGIAAVALLIGLASITDHFHVVTTGNSGTDDVLGPGLYVAAFGIVAWGAGGFGALMAAGPVRKSSSEASPTTETRSSS